MDVYGTMHIMEIYHEPSISCCPFKTYNRKTYYEDKYRKRRNALINSAAGAVASVITTFVISFIALIISNLASEEADWVLTWQEYAAAVVVGMLSGYLSVYLSGVLFTFVATFIAIVFTNIIFKYTGLDYAEGVELVEEIILALIVVFIVIAITKMLFDDNITEDDSLKDDVFLELIPVLVVSNIVLNIALLIFGGVWSKLTNKDAIRSRVILDADIFI